MFPLAKFSAKMPATSRCNIALLTCPGHMTEIEMVKYVFFVSPGLNHLIETKRVWKECTLSAGGGGGAPAEPEIPWRGLPSKYYPGPMLLNFSVQNCSEMGTGVSNMVNPLTKYVLCRRRWPRQVHSLFIAVYESVNVANIFAKKLGQCKRAGTNTLISPGNTYWRGRLGTVDLLTKVDCLVKKVNNIFSIKMSWSELVSTMRSTVRVPCIKSFFMIYLSWAWKSL